ncbi:Iron-sulfur clusters incorporation protein [Bulinus truncatus]|nr:Iron-sulfur clusters incorporation protein [Bulinus truncatus]
MWKATDEEFEIKFENGMINKNNANISRSQGCSALSGLKQHAVSQLESRGVIRFAGADTESFLQGLITNDVYQLAGKSPAAMYAMVLNVQGRVLYDLFLYNVTKSEEESTVLFMDVDLAVKDELMNLFKKYRLRKKVDISDASSLIKVWAQWNVGSNLQDHCKDVKNVLSFNDPRVPTLGNRVLTEHENPEILSNATEKEYRIHRYKLGVPEGVVDLPPGNCFPLESNLAIMNGVNFQKGCYIGQELTARTFHTGVTRKRLMPIHLNSQVKIDTDTTIFTKENGKNAGKFRSCQSNYGLGLLRLEYIHEDLILTAQDGQTVSAKTHVPDWWPKNALTV